VNGQKHGVQEFWCYSGVDPSNPWQATDAAQQCRGEQKDTKYYLDGVEVSQEAYRAYVEGLAPCIQETIDFEEPNLSRVIAGYLLP
jgi:hypothetical protein